MSKISVCRLRKTIRVLSVTYFWLIFVVMVEASEPSSEETPAAFSKRRQPERRLGKTNWLLFSSQPLLPRVSFHTITHLLSRNYAFNLTLSSSLFVEWWFRCDQVRFPVFIAPRVYQPVDSFTEPNSFFSSKTIRILSPLRNSIQAPDSTWWVLLIVPRHPK